MKKMPTDEFTDEQRASYYAENEELDVLWSALFCALEADLSSQGWPKNTMFVFQTASDEIEWLIRQAK